MNSHCGIVPLDLSEHASMPTMAAPNEPEPLTLLQDPSIFSPRQSSGDVSEPSPLVLCAAEPMELGWTGTVLGTPPSACSDDSSLITQPEPTCDVGNVITASSVASDAI